MEVFEKIFTSLANLSSKLPVIEVGAYFIIAIVFIIALGIIIGLTFFGSQTVKLKRASRKISKYLENVYSIDDDNVSSFTTECFSSKAPHSLRDAWVEYIGVRFGYPSDLISETEVFDKEVKKFSNFRANLFIGIALIVIAFFAFWGLGALAPNEIGVILCLGLLISAVIYIVLLVLGKNQSRKAREAFYKMQEDLDVKINLQVEKNYSTDASPLIEISAIIDEIVARNSSKSVDAIEELEDTNIDINEYDFYDDNEVLDAQIKIEEIIAEAEKDVSATQQEEAQTQVEESEENKTGANAEIANAEDATELANTEDTTELVDLENIDTESIDLNNAKTDNYEAVEIDNVENKNADFDSEEAVNAEFDTEESKESIVKNKSEQLEEIIADNAFENISNEIADTDETINGDTDTYDHILDLPQKEPVGESLEELEKEDDKSIAQEMTAVDLAKVADTTLLDTAENLSEMNAVSNESVDELSEAEEKNLLESETEEAEEISPSCEEQSPFDRTAPVKLTNEEILEIDDKSNLDEYIVNNGEDDKDMFGRKKKEEQLKQQEALSQQNNVLFAESEIIDENEFVESEIVDEPIAAQEVALDSVIEANEPTVEETSLEAIEPVAEEETVESVEETEEIEEVEEIEEIEEVEEVEEVEEIEEVEEETSDTEETEEVEEVEEVEEIVETEEETEEVEEIEEVEEVETEEVEEVEEIEEEQSDEIAAEQEEVVYVVDGPDDDDEIAKPAKLDKLPHLVDYMLSQPMSKSMKIKIATLLLQTYNAFKNSPEDKAIVIKCIMKVMAVLR